VGAEVSFATKFGPQRTGRGRTEPQKGANGGGKAPVTRRNKAVNLAKSPVLARPAGKKNDKIYWGGYSLGYWGEKEEKGTFLKIDGLRCAGAN